MFHLVDAHEARTQLFSALHTRAARAYEDAAVGMFHLRDVRGGDGRREPFYVLMAELATIQPELALNLLALVPQYGSWDDMFKMADKIPFFKNEIYTLAERQLVADEIRLSLGQPISEFAKWVPDEKKSMRAIAVEFAHRLVPAGTTATYSQIMGSYRRRIGRLNKVVNPVEIYECAGRWDEIDPARVSAGAHKIKSAAYLNVTLYDSSIQRSADPRRIGASKKFKEFYAAAEQKTYTSHMPDSPRYDLVRAAVREWAEGGWRV